MNDLSLNARTLTDWMDQRQIGSGSDAVADLRPLSGGTQNRLIGFRRSDIAYVLRMPPVAAGQAGDRTILREARLLCALDQTGVPHPRFYAAEPDAGVFGAAFYIMSRVPGHTVMEEPFATGLPAQARRRLALDVVDAFAALADVDHKRVGLASYGRPQGFLDRQVERWLGQLDGYRSYREYPGPDLPFIDEISLWLNDNQPPTQRAGILHGDALLGNVLFHADRPTVAALIDWELSTVGDPLLDLGELLATWPDQRGRSVLGPVATPASAGSWPAEHDLIARYRSRTSRDLVCLPWYVILACFRLAIILEGSRARAFAGQAPKDVGEALHVAAVGLLHQADRRIRQLR